MPQIIDHGIAENIVNKLEGEKLRVDPIARKFITFINEIGGVHTIAVAVDHPASTGEELLKWFLAAKAAVESGQHDSQPAGVLTAADKSVTEGHPFTQPQAEQPAATQGGAG